MSEDNAQQFSKLIENFDNGMLITRTGAGELRARPMVIARHGGDDTLYFATSRGSAKTSELEAYPDVAVTMQSPNRYLSVSGRAEEIHDRALIENFFSPAWKVWFPEGKDDPELIVVKVAPSHGEYWNMGETLNKARFVFEAGKAYLRGEAIDTDKLGGHGKVDLE